MDSSEVSEFKIKIFLILFLFLITFTTIPLSGFAATIYVPDDYSTIQRAVDGASSGAMKIIREETYSKNVHTLRRRPK